MQATELMFTAIVLSIDCQVRDMLRSHVVQLDQETSGLQKLEADKGRQAAQQVQVSNQPGAEDQSNQVPDIKVQAVSYGTQLIACTQC